MWAGRMRGLVGQGGVHVWNKCSCEELMTEIRLQFEDNTSRRPKWKCSITLALVNPHKLSVDHVSTQIPVMQTQSI